jgi:germination protein M
MQRSIYVLVLVVILGAAACSGSASTPAVGTSPAESASTAFAFALAEPTQSPSPSPDPSTTPSGAPELPPEASTLPMATVPPAPLEGVLPLEDPLTGDETVTVRTYFMIDGEVGSAGLVPVLRGVPMSDSIETAAVRALLAGPNATERSASPAISTRIPSGTRLLGLTIHDTVATVDLSAEFETEGDRRSVVGRIAQIVYTLTVYPWIHAVAFEVEGRPLAAMAGGEVVLSAPIGRTDPTGHVPYLPLFEEALPTILVDGPSWGEILYDGTIVTGTSRADVPQFTIALFDAAGRQLSEVGGTKLCLGQCRGGFEARIDFVVAEPQWGVLRVAQLDQAGMSMPLARDYPVWLISIDPPEGDPCGC